MRRRFLLRSTCVCLFFSPSNHATLNHLDPVSSVHTNTMLSGATLRLHSPDLHHRRPKPGEPGMWLWLLEKKGRLHSFIFQKPASHCEPAMRASLPWTEVEACASQVFAEIAQLGVSLCDVRRRTAAWCLFAHLLLQPGVNRFGSTRWKDMWVCFSLR